MKTLASLETAQCFTMHPKIFAGNAAAPSFARGVVPNTIPSLWKRPLSEPDGTTTVVGLVIGAPLRDGLYEVVPTTGPEALLFDHWVQAQADTADALVTLFTELGRTGTPSGPGETVPDVRYAPIGDDGVVQLGCTGGHYWLWTDESVTRHTNTAGLGAAAWTHHTASLHAATMLGLLEEKASTRRELMQAIANLP